MLLLTLCASAHPGNVGLVSLRSLPGLRSTYTRTAVASAAALLESSRLSDATLRHTAAHWHVPIRV